LAFEEWIAGEEFNSDQLRLLRLVESQIEANPDMAAFDLYRFTQPPFSFNGGVQRARQLFGGDEGLRSMISSLNAAVFPSSDEGQAEQPFAAQ
jgi:hypothetical protein